MAGCAIGKAFPDGNIDEQKDLHIYQCCCNETNVLAWFAHVHAHRCERSDSKRNGPRTITASHYHSQIGVEVPPYELLTSWTRDLRRFDNVVTGIWVLYQVGPPDLHSESLERLKQLKLAFSVMCPR
jgi:hypothetical protein